MTGLGRGPRPFGAILTSEQAVGNALVAAVDCSMWCTCALQVVASNGHTPRVERSPARRASRARNRGGVSGWTTRGTAGRATENPRMGSPSPGPQLCEDQAGSQGVVTGSGKTPPPRRGSRLNTPVSPGAGEACVAVAGLVDMAVSGGVASLRRVPHALRSKMTRSHLVVPVSLSATPSPQDCSDRVLTREERRTSHPTVGLPRRTVDAAAMMPSHPTDTPLVRPATRGARATPRRPTQSARSQRGKEHAHARIHVRARPAVHMTPSAVTR